MRITFENGIKTLHLAETHPEETLLPREAFAMFRIYQLLTNGSTTRDVRLFNRRLG